MNANELARLEKLEQAVFADIENQTDKILSDARKSAAELLKGAEAADEQHDDASLSAASDNKYKRLYSGKELELRQKLLKRRCELEDEIFADVEKRLHAFTATPAYEEYISRRLGELSPASGDVIAVRPSDAYHHLFLESGAQIRSDASILLGGFMLIRNNVICDCTLDAAVKRKRSSFGADYGERFRRCDE